eukprot:38182_1
MGSCTSLRSENTLLRKTSIQYCYIFDDTKNDNKKTENQHDIYTHIPKYDESLSTDKIDNINDIDEKNNENNKDCQTSVESVNSIDEPLLFDKLHNEFVHRGISTNDANALLSYLSVHEYDTDIVEYDVFSTDHENQSVLYHEINNSKFFSHFQDIVDDHINEYDKYQHDSNTNKKCQSLFDMDDALCSYFVSMGGNRDDYHDENGFGIFNRMCGDYKEDIWTN